ncbi:MerR family transcriptional regulator [Rhodococcus sp. SGAir0479]|uniref:MerR family transcriptional regulator n=1 Tax=Rhodococcus sp. SGAir0479 TaxID=2567884 RepID=UPI0010CCD44A|nr:MerR family transcriptional regulator [Rhodococcus sp. SGAir0479]QCQ91794.1 MerR family transcriptional regulator [Rhodococcus sp. SGAir0479]
MRIGELSRRTGLTPRMLRYYEQQGLLQPNRSANGYRDFSERDVERAQTIRDLVTSGVPTRLIPAVLDRRDGARVGWTGECDRILAGQLSSEIESLDSRIACLTRSRNALDELLGLGPVQLRSERADN